MKRFLCILCALMLLLSLTAGAEVSIILVDPDGTETSLSFPQAEETDDEVENEKAEGIAEAEPAEKTARDCFIDDILALAKEKYDQAGGRAQKAANSSDIYICKNFTVYLFRKNASKYRIAEYPNVSLVIPDNLPKEKCVGFSYGIKWKDISAENGNPFYVAAQFIYDESKSVEENREAARELLKQAKRGDYFQMSANYYYGVGAHSMIFSGDYDPETDTVIWCDSNMKGEKRDGVRYGYVQWNAVREIDWFVDAFCQKSRGATIYRLRDDLIFAEE